LTTKRIAHSAAIGETSGIDLPVVNIRYVGHMFDNGLHKSHVVGACFIGRTEGDISVPKIPITRWGY
jgi:hypothetical protein